MKTRNIFALAAFTLGLSACNLDYDPTSAVANSTLTEDDYEYLLVGVYDGAQSFSMGHLYVIDEVASDNLNCRSWYPEIDGNYLTDTDSKVNSTWESLYSSIQLCNNLITLLEDKSEITDDDLRMEAEAKVIRAWLYMRVVAFWGDAPLLTVVTDEEVARSPEEDVWALIQEDLEYAVEYADDFNEAGQASSIAAKAMLARALLIAPEEVQDKSRAAELAEEVIADGRFELADDYADIWHSKTSDEILLQWTNTTSDSGSPGWFLRSNLVTTYEETYGSGSAGYGDQGRYEFPVDNAMWNAYEDGDTRKDSSVRYLSVGGSETWDCVKFPSYDADDSWPVVRIAEMYLVSAEAQGYPAGVTRLNELRVNRGLSAYTAGSDITDDNFIELIMQERRVELFCEGFRWYDLRRWWNMGEEGQEAVLSFRCYQTGETSGSRPTASDNMNIADDGYNLLWPVPATAIENDPNLLPNNPGY